MSGGVFTTPKRAQAVVDLHTRCDWQVEDIAEGLLMNPDKDRAILHERGEAEQTADQMRAITGPFFPLTAPKQEGGA